MSGTLDLALKESVYTDNVHLPKKNNHCLLPESEDWGPKSDSIRITLSDLDPQQVDIRETGHFQPCFPASRSVRRPVFTSKHRMIH
jgi:hypothetical protein